MKTKITTIGDTTTIRIEGIIEHCDEFINVLKSIESDIIIVEICSTGGKIEVALELYNTLCGLNAKVITRTYGYIAGAGTIIAQSANKRCREMSETGLYLICNTGDIIMDKIVATLYSSRSGKSVTEIEGLMNENDGTGKWLTVDEAIEVGLIDKSFKKKVVIIDSRSESQNM
jgi:ATP-dependent protease ClpP protease subunit